MVPGLRSTSHRVDARLEPRRKTLILASQLGERKRRGKGTYCKHLPDRDALRVVLASDAVFCVFVTIPGFGTFD